MKKTYYIIIDLPEGEPSASYRTKEEICKCYNVTMEQLERALAHVALLRGRGIEVWDYNPFEGDC